MYGIHHSVSTLAPYSIMTTLCSVNISNSSSCSIIKFIVSIVIIIIIITFNSISIFISGPKQVHCSDFFGRTNVVYRTTGKPTGIAIVNSVAYIVQRQAHSTR